MLQTPNSKLQTSLARQNLICGIDVGNSFIKTVIAEVDRQSLVPRILGVGTAESLGMRRGAVVDMNETIENISSSVKQAEAMAGVRTKKAYVSLNGPHIKTQTSKGVIAVSRADNQISQNDIDRVVEAASVISLPSNREIIHVLPRIFTIDGQEQVRNPLGMRGVRLEADVYIIEGLSPHIHNVAKCINANDIEVTDFVYSPIAVSMTALDRQQREYGVLNLDFGGGTSTFALFHEGDMIHTGVIPIGSRHITNDLAVALRTTMDTAERVKKEYGAVTSAILSKKDQIALSEIMGESNYLLSRREVNRIVEARVSEIFDLVATELKKLPRQNMLPGGVVLIGGGANLQGIADFAKDKLKLPVRIATQYHFNGNLAERISDPSLAVAVGLVAWGLNKEFGDVRHGSSGPKSQISPGMDGAKKIFSWLKNFVP